MAGNPNTYSGRTTDGKGVTLQMTNAHSVKITVDLNGDNVPEITLVADESAKGGITVLQCGQGEVNSPPILAPVILTRAHQAVDESVRNKLTVENSDELLKYVRALVDHPLSLTKLSTPKDKVCR